MKLTEHFDLDEFGEVPVNAAPSYLELCSLILEPIRAHFQKPIMITSGYRSPAHNKEIGGVSNSQHVATDEYCAADIRIQYDLKFVFGWIRLQSDLPFDQVILEHDVNGIEECIHISWSKEPRRVAYSGMVNGMSKYQREVVV